MNHERERIAEVERKLAAIPGLEAEVGMANSGTKTLWPVVAAAIELKVVAAITVAPVRRL
jgi:hypothetical protein